MKYPAFGTVTCEPADFLAFMIEEYEFVISSKRDRIQGGSTGGGRIKRDVCCYPPDQGSYASCAFQAVVPACFEIKFQQPQPLLHDQTDRSTILSQAGCNRIFRNRLPSQNDIDSFRFWIRLCFQNR